MTTSLHETSGAMASARSARSKPIDINVQRVPYLPENYSSPTCVSLFNYPKFCKALDVIGEDRTFREYQQYMGCLRDFERGDMYTTSTLRRRHYEQYVSWALHQHNLEEKMLSSN